MAKTVSSVGRYIETIQMSAWLHVISGRDESRLRQAVRVGLEKSLPLTLLLTFLLLPSVATRAFKTFKCDRFAYNDFS
eukprot:5265985-Prymnesium_polylepis.1